MTDAVPAINRIGAIFVIAATVATLAFNFFAAVGLVNGVRPEDVSNKYYTVVTPAGYAFSIWSLIYLGLSAFSIHQMLPKNWAKFGRLRWLYVVTCILNCGWIYFWHHEQIVVCFILIVLLAGVLAYINSTMREISGPAEYLFVKAPFGIYFGWVSVAALVNFAVMLVYLRVPLSNIQWIALSIMLIFIASGLGVGVRLKLRNYLYPLAIAWALTAIAVKQSGQTLIVVACAIGTVACLIAAFTFVVNLPSYSTQPAAK